MSRRFWVPGFLRSHCDMEDDPQIPTFLIVTPSFNSARYIDETIASVVTQCGQFRIRYHVQDGGSKDGTLKKVRQWDARLKSKIFPTGCEAIEFSHASRADGGMYDAIAAGFERLGAAEAAYMTWLNSDDCLMPGALSFVARTFREFADISLLGGRPCEMDDAGVRMRVHDVQVYAQRTLAAGLHDGRKLAFVMQEGTFWRGALWKRAGGVRSDLRLASDFDLWRRFAAHAQFVSADIVLAAHRRHAAQLTHSHEAYYREVDAILSELPSDAREREWDCFRRWHARSASTPDPSFSGPVLSYLPGVQRWNLEMRPYPAPLNATVYVSSAGAGCVLPARYLSGFLGEDGPYPHLNLPPGIRTVAEQVALIQFDAPAAGGYRIGIRFRTFSNGIEAAVAHGTQKLLDTKLPLTYHERDGVLSVDAEFTTGLNTVTLTLMPPAGPGAHARLLVISCGAAPVAGAAGPADEASGGRPDS